MGLSITAVSHDYHYDEEKEEYVGEERATVTCGYVSWKRFRDDLTIFCTNGDIERLEDVFNLVSGCFIVGQENCDVLTDLKKIKKMENCNKHYNDLVKIKKKYPKLFNCLGIIVHMDCEGFVPNYQIKEMLPVIKEFFDKSQNNQYGYKSWDYDWKEEFIYCLESAIEMEGDLFFS